MSSACDNHEIKKILNEITRMLSDLFDTNSMFNGLGIRRNILLGEPSIVNTTQTPVIVLDIDYVDDQSRGTGLARPRDINVAFRIELMISSFHNKSLGKIEAWCAMVDIYDFFKANDKRIASCCSKTAQTKFGAINFDKKRKVLDNGGTMNPDWVYTYSFNIETQIGRQVEQARRR